MTKKLTTKQRVARYIKTNEDPRQEQFNQLLAEVRA